jgi:hypothetical protein
MPMGLYILVKLPESACWVFRYLTLAACAKRGWQGTRAQCPDAGKARAEAASGGMDPLFSSLSIGPQLCLRICQPRPLYPTEILRRLISAIRSLSNG